MFLVKNDLFCCWFCIHFKPYFYKPVVPTVIYFSDACGFHDLPCLGTAESNCRWCILPVWSLLIGGERQMISL